MRNLANYDRFEHAAAFALTTAFSAVALTIFSPENFWLGLVAAIGVGLATRVAKNPVKDWDIWPRSDNLICEFVPAFVLTAAAFALAGPTLIGLGILESIGLAVVSGLAAGYIDYLREKELTKDVF